MGEFHNKQFPGESQAYRQARDEVLQMEVDLRKLTEEVAAKRRGLPLGGKLKKDYIFDEGVSDLSDPETVKRVRFSELFEDGKDSLLIYSFMYGPDWEKPCPMCNSLLDSLNGNVIHAQQRINLAVVAKAPIQKIRSWARERGWEKLRLLSSANNTYNFDYFAEDDKGEQLPDINVFRKTADGIFHFYNAELFFVPTNEGQDPRHADSIWPLWNLFDMTPEGRGAGWYPNVSYDTSL